MSYCGKYLDKARYWILLCVCVRNDICWLFVHSYRVYCMLGDGETAEGSVWEAAAFSSHYQLDNLVAIVDVNRQESSLC